MKRSVVFYITVFLSMSASLRGQALEPLEKLRDNYANVTAIHVKVQLVTTTAPMIADKPLLGTYEWWATGDKYRENFVYEGAKGRGADYNVAYNGIHHQIFDRERSSLYYRKKKIRTEPFSPPNPVLAPLAFIRPEGKMDGSVRLRWSDVQSSKVWHNILSGATAASGHEGAPRVMEVPYAYGREGHSGVRFGGETGWLPEEIRRMNPKTGLVTRFVIDEYGNVDLEGGRFWYPKTVRISVLKDGEVITEQKSTVEEIEVNEAPPPGVFTIDHSLADTVRDEDFDIWVKTRSGPPFPEDEYIDVSSADSVGETEQPDSPREKHAERAEQREGPEAAGAEGRAGRFWLTVGLIAAGCAVAGGILAMRRRVSRSS